MEAKELDVLHTCTASDCPLRLGVVRLLVYHWTMQCETTFTLVVFIESPGQTTTTTSTTVFHHILLVCLLSHFHLHLVCLALSSCSQKLFKKDGKLWCSPVRYVIFPVQFTLGMDVRKGERVEEEGKMIGHWSFDNRVHWSVNHTMSMGTVANQLPSLQFGLFSHSLGSFILPSSTTTTCRAQMVSVKYSTWSTKASRYSVQWPTEIVTSVQCENKTIQEQFINDQCMQQVRVLATLSLWLHLGMILLCDYMVIRSGVCVCLFIVGVTIAQCLVVVTIQLACDGNNVQNQCHQPRSWWWKPWRIAHLSHRKGDIDSHTYAQTDWLAERNHVDIDKRSFTQQIVVVHDDQG